MHFFLSLQVKPQSRGYRLSSTVNLESRRRMKVNLLKDEIRNSQLLTRNNFEKIQQPFHINNFLPDLYTPDKSAFRSLLISSDQSYC